MGIGIHHKALTVRVMGLVVFVQVLLELLEGGQIGGEHRRGGRRVLYRRGWWERSVSKRVVLRRCRIPFIFGWSQSD